MTLKEWLKKNDMSPTDLAEELGVDRRTVHYWMDGTNKCPPKQRKAIIGLTNGAISSIIDIKDVDLWLVLDQGRVKGIYTDRATAHMSAKETEDIQKVKANKEIDYGI